MMYCLTDICYVCLQKKNSLISSVNSSVSVNEELRRIIGGYLAFNQPWLKTKRIILTCEECNLLLRQTYQFLKMWHKNTALMQGYIDLLNTTTMPDTGNEAELQVHVDIKQPDVNVVKREVKLEDEQIYSWEHNIEETEDALIVEETNDVFLNVEESFVKEENIWKREVADDSEERPTDNNATEDIEEADDVLVNSEDSSVKEDNNRVREEVDDDMEEYPTGNNCTESIDNNESDSDKSLSDNADLTNTASVNSGFAGKQMHAPEEGDDESNTANKKSYKCSTCGKSFIAKVELNRHIRIHVDKKSYECAICKKRFTRKESLVIHMRVHTGVKPHECTTCKKCFAVRSNLIAHMRTHTGEKPYECTTCKKCFTKRSHLVEHMRTHTGEKPYECTTCKKCFTQRSRLIQHMRIHTGEKPYECTTCKKCYTERSHLVEHMRTHTGEKPYECATCKKCFGQYSQLVQHMRTHTGEKPYECAICNTRFSQKGNVNKHMRRKHADEEPH